MKKYILILSFLPGFVCSVFGQVDTQYGGMAAPRKNPGPLPANLYVQERNEINAFKNKTLKDPKRTRSEFGVTYLLTLPADYTYQSWGFDPNSPFITEKFYGEANLLPFIGMNFYYKAHIHLVDQLYASPGIILGDEMMLFEDKNSEYGETELMNNVYYLFNAGITYNPGSFVLGVNYLFGSVMTPSSGMMGLELSLGYKNKNNTLVALKYRMSGSSVSVTQSSEFAAMERDYSVSTIGISISGLSVFNYTKAERAELNAIRTKYAQMRSGGLSVPPMVMPPAPVKPAAPVQVNKYKDYSDARLKELLDENLKKENYSEAELIQKEIDRRNADSKYKTYSTEQLQTMLQEALKKEDYGAADAIQRELDSRKKSPSPSDSKSKTNSGKPTLKELEDELKKAMDAEDYKKAEEIQKQINNYKKD